MCALILFLKMVNFCELQSAPGRDFQSFAPIQQKRFSRYSVLGCSNCSKGKEPLRLQCIVSSYQRKDLQDTYRGGSRKIRNRGPEKLWRQHSLAPYPQHNPDCTIPLKRRLVTLVFRINPREKGGGGGGGTAPRPPPKSAHDLGGKPLITELYFT